MEEFTAETKSCIRCEESYKKHRTKGSNSYKFPVFWNGFNEGEQSMIEIHKGIVDRVKEYLWLFQDDTGLVNHAFKTELEKLEALIWKP